LQEESLSTLYKTIKLSQNFTVSCFDCSQHDDESPYGKARAYFAAPHLQDTESESKPRIVVCSNRVESSQDIKSVLVHEMIHAYDHCVSRKDLTKCEELACSEVRAAREGECRDNFNNGFGELCSLFGVNPLNNSFNDGSLGEVCEWFKKRCIKEHAVRSTSIVFPIDGPNCVKSVFERCYRDFEPIKGVTSFSRKSKKGSDSDLQQK